MTDNDAHMAEVLKRLLNSQSRIRKLKARKLDVGKTKKTPSLDAQFRNADNQDIFAE